MFDQPFFITPHAVKRYQQRVRSTTAHEAITRIQSVLQENQPIDTITYDHRPAKIYIATDCGVVFYLPVMPGDGDWPAVVSLLPLEYGIYPRFRTEKKFTRKYCPWSVEEFEALRALVREKIPCKEIARYMGRTTKGVQGKLYREKVKCKRVKFWAKMEVAWAVHLATEDLLDYGEIAKKNETVKNVCKNETVPISKGITRWKSLSRKS